MYGSLGFFLLNLLLHDHLVSWYFGVYFFLVCFLVFSCGAVVLDSWNRKRWTQPTCSLGLSYESRVNRLGGVASSVSLGRLNRPSSLLHVPSLDLPCLVRVCSSPHPSATCNVARVTRPACPRDMPLGA